MDLPGYGYARSSKKDINAWTALVRDYLRGRLGLRRVCLLLDSRRGATKNDLEIMDMLDKAAVVYQIVLTKSDKVKQAAVDSRLAELNAALKTRAAALTKILVTSARKKWGVVELRATLHSLVNPKPLG